MLQVERQEGTLVLQFVGKIMLGFDLSGLDILLVHFPSVYAERYSYISVCKPHVGMIA